MIAPASVPQVITVESFHHKVVAVQLGNHSTKPHRSAATEIIDVSQTSEVSGAS